MAQPMTPRASVSALQLSGRCPWGTTSLESSILVAVRGIPGVIQGSRLRAMTTASSREAHRSTGIRMTSVLLNRTNQKALFDMMAPTLRGYRLTEVCWTLVLADPCLRRTVGARCRLTSTR